MRWKCNDCDWRGADDQLLRAPNPFEPRETICACPECRQVNDFTNMCDEPGCKLEAGCGWKPKDEEYRRTCGKHMGEHHPEPRADYSKTAPDDLEAA